jgi:hypothetical protein
MTAPAAEEAVRFLTRTEVAITRDLPGIAYVVTGAPPREPTGAESAAYAQRRHDGTYTAMLGAPINLPVPAAGDRQAASVPAVANRAPSGGMSVAGRDGEPQTPGREVTSEGCALDGLNHAQGLPGPEAGTRATLATLRENRAGETPDDAAQLDAHSEEALAAFNLAHDEQDAAEGGAS